MTTNRIHKLCTIRARHTCKERVGPRWFFNITQGERTSRIVSNMDGTELVAPKTGRYRHLNFRDIKICDLSPR